MCYTIGVGVMFYFNDSNTDGLFTVADSNSFSGS